MAQAPTPLARRGGPGRLAARVAAHEENRPLFECDATPPRRGTVMAATPKPPISPPCLHPQRNRAKTNSATNVT